MSEFEELQRRLKHEQELARSKAEIDEYKRAAAKAARELAELHAHHTIQEELVRVGVDPEFAPRVAKLVFMESKFREAPDKREGTLKLVPDAYQGKTVDTVSALVKTFIEVNPYLGPDSAAAGASDSSGASSGSGTSGGSVRLVPTAAERENMSAVELADLGLHQHDQKRRPGKLGESWKDLSPAEMAQLAWSTPPDSPDRGTRQ